MSQDHALPTRHFPDTGTAAMEFLLKNHPLAKDDQELQAQNRELRAENQELANRLEKAFQETKAIRQRAEAIQQERDTLFEVIRSIAEAGTEITEKGLEHFSDSTFELINDWIKKVSPELFESEQGQ